ncbi:MAG TPA: alpha/beta hydrolase-fold protein [Caulobacteraceae bacterium]|nr:alpha/beta hydrolase-fold protein [Caulobacteraceae bacterium]
MADDASMNDRRIGATPVSIPWSTQFDVASAITGRTYRIFVFQPPTPAPPAGYPAMTVLDGNMTFPIAAAMAATYAWSMCPTMVVGVGYPSDNPAEMMLSRFRDLTPETSAEGIPQRPGLPALSAEHVGGADGFHRFLTEELRPLIAARHAVDAERQALFGYSLGGLFTLHALFTQPAAWRSYAAASPSIWWDDAALLSREGGFRHAVEQGEASPRVLISVGAREQEPPLRTPPGMSADEIAALIEEGRMVDNAWELGSRLERLRGGEGYRAVFHAFDEEDHLTGLAASIGRALDFATRE